MEINGMFMKYNDQEIYVYTYIYKTDKTEIERNFWIC